MNRDNDRFHHQTEIGARLYEITKTEIAEQHIE
jgi:hypothetical protein